MGGILGGKPDTSAQQAQIEAQRKQMEQQEARMREQQTEEARKLQAQMRARRAGGSRALLGEREDAELGVGTKM